jgi:hypothetical protein
MAVRPDGPPRVGRQGGGCGTAACAYFPSWSLLTVSL